MHKYTPRPLCAHAPRTRRSRARPGSRLAQLEGGGRVAVAFLCPPSFFTVKQKGEEVSTTLEPGCPSLPGTHVPHCHADAPFMNMVIHGGGGGGQMRELRG